MKWLVLILLFPLVLSSCASTEKFDTSTPEGAFKAAHQLETDERYEEAIQKYNDVKNKFPYSKYSIDAELKVADIQYERENYIEAQNAYQLFKDFHPKHPRIDYVTYRLAMSYYQQLPSTTDRDLSLADKTILYFDEVINSYPQSKYVAECKEKKISVLKMLADKEMYVAHFYFIREMYESALGRYEYLLKTYPHLGYDARALYGAAYSAHKIGQPDKAQKYYTALREQYPDSTEFRKAERELKSYEK